MWLLDTMVISELRKRVPDQNVVSWLSSTAEKDLYISVVTISEIQRGIALQRSIDAPFAERLQRWLDALMKNYSDRLLPITSAIACRRGELSARVGHDGADVMIAATALQHGLSVATRNERHFSFFSVPILNPYLNRRRTQS
ncbi:MAG: type II toxin-antitoxin system VapC family toxin [Desulfuromonadaceae bacterium]